ncbi:MAG: 3-dehydroquinate synthase [Actinomycetota bacterium]
MRTVRVDLGPRSYDVHVGAGALAGLAGLIPEAPDAERVVIISDRNVDVRWGSAAERGLAGRGRVERLAVPAGEGSKSLGEAENLLAELARLQVRRTDLIVALGGGMVGDLAGFVASVYLRGIPLVQAPTTLLAQVDAAIGGKTAVNLPEGKNLVGTFSQPLAVVADPATLATLPEREYRSGLAEVVKYGLCFEPGILELLEERAGGVEGRDEELLEEIVARCAAIKAAVVSEDEYDVADRRAILNYGHTLAHALEAHGGYRQWLHGEAVAVGMVFAAALAAELGMIGDDEVAHHLRLLDRLGLPTSAPAIDVDEAARLWSVDKKYRMGQRWVLLKAIGSPVITAAVDPASVARAAKRVLPG